MSLLNPSPDDAERAWTTPGEPGAVRYFCPFDCGWFYDAASMDTLVDRSFARLCATGEDAAFETIKEDLMETEGIIREHLTEHTAAVILSEEGET